MHSSTPRLVGPTLVALAALIGWDLAGLDLEAARLAGHAAGFPLRDHWLPSGVLHTGARYLAWLFVLALCIVVVWPVGAFRRIPTARRVQVAATALLASGFITLLKAASHTSCPWDLTEFGGVARHVSHWSGWMASDGGAGRCFPAGHASTGFAFIGGYFALRADLPRLASRWLGVSLAAGLVLGLAQQWRGAHFMSHTLWTGWICWTTALLVDPLFAGRGAPRQLEAAP